MFSIEVLLYLRSSYDYTPAVFLLFFLQSYCENNRITPPLVLETDISHVCQLFGFTLKRNNQELKQKGGYRKTRTNVKEIKMKNKRINNQYQARNLSQEMAEQAGT